MSYLSHGERHRALGSDPTLRPWAYLFDATTTSIAANGGSGNLATRVVVPSGYFFYTTDPSVFTVDKTTHGGTDYYGLVFNAIGHYDVNCSFVSVDTPAAASYTLEDDGSGGSDSAWTQGNAAFNYAPVVASNVVGVQLNLGEIQTVDGSTFPTPTTPLVFQVRNYSNVTFHGNVVTRVEFIDNDPTFL